MSFLGVRCFPEALSYVVVDGALAAMVLVEHDHCRMPQHSRPAQLVWLRNEVREIIQRTHVQAVAFKVAESNAQMRDLGRAEAEGVLQEAVQSLGIEPVRRVKTQIKADLDFPEQARYIGNVLANYPALAGLPGNRREAALVALSALSHA